MARVVISFLGLASDVVAYKFPSGRAPCERFFLPALLQELHDSNRSADRVAVLGVRTSSWYDLLEDLPSHEAIASKDRRDFAAYAKSDATDDAISERWTELASQTGRRFAAVILRDLAGVSDAAENEEVFALTLSAIEQAACAGLDKLSGDEKNCIILDLGRGIRHQPLIALLAAIYIERLPQYDRVEIEHIFSASRLHDFDRDAPQNEAEVRDLGGIVNLGQWIFALGAFNASGDTGVFSDALQKDNNNGKAVELLRKGAALERATRTEAAAVTIREAIDRLDATEERAFALRGAGRAFAEKFEEALDWVHQVNPFHQQRELAKRHLKHKDWLRAATLMLEACRIRLVDNVDPTKAGPAFARCSQFDQRHRAANNYRDVNNPSWFAHIRKPDCPAAAAAFDRRVADFETLRLIRNALAHAGEPDAAVEKIVAVPADLHTELNRLYAALLEDGRPFP